MIYCMSDIHGEIDRFHIMLQLIDLKEEDTLYVIGDVIDRHPGGVDILLEIMQAKNIVMLLGNHEDMCLKTLGDNHQVGAKNLWQSNGGSSTYREMVYHMTSVGRNQILQFLKKCPIELDVEAGGKSYRLVHGWPGKTTDDKIWGRPLDFIPSTLPKNAIAIIGHTPTIYLDTDDGASPFKIFHSKSQRFIDIDCGCGNKTERRRLACLRLDDLKEYYV